MLAEELREGRVTPGRRVRLRAPAGIGAVQLFSGIHRNVAADGTVEMSETMPRRCCEQGGRGRARPICPNNGGRLTSQAPAWSARVGGSVNIAPASTPSRLREQEQARTRSLEIFAVGDLSLPNQQAGTVTYPPLRLTPAQRETGPVSRRPPGERWRSDGAGRRSRLPAQSRQAAD